jgi:hypothetical protein
MKEAGALAEDEDGVSLVEGVAQEGSRRRRCSGTRRIGGGGDGWLYLVREGRTAAELRLQLSK